METMALTDDKRNSSNAALLLCKCNNSSCMFGSAFNYINLTVGDYFTMIVKKLQALASNKPVQVIVSVGRHNCKQT